MQSATREGPADITNTSRPGNPSEQGPGWAELHSFPAAGSLRSHLRRTGSTAIIMAGEASAIPDPDFGKQIKDSNDGKYLYGFANLYTREPYPR
jgi:hypothetical protein